MSTWRTEERRNIETWSKGGERGSLGALDLPTTHALPPRSRRGEAFLTMTGFLERVVSSCLLPAPIIVVCTNPKVARQLAAVGGSAGAGAGNVGHHVRLSISSLRQHEYHEGGEL